MKKLIFLLFFLTNLSFSQDSLNYKFKSNLFLIKKNPFHLSNDFNFKKKNLVLDKTVNYTTYFDRICYPKETKDQMKAVVLDYIFNKYVIKKLFFSKE
jgi:hypothetical protein